MSSEQAQALLEQGIQAAKAGRKDEARKLIQQSLRLDQNNDAAWLWLASLSQDKRERLLCLQRVLLINPNNEMGIKAVQALGIDPAQLLAAARPEASAPSQPPQPETPAVEDEYLDEKFTDAEEVFDEPFVEDEGIFEEYDETPFDEYEEDAAEVFAEDAADDYDSLFEEAAEEFAADDVASPAIQPQVTLRPKPASSDASGVPIPHPDTINEAMEMVDSIVQDYLKEAEPASVNWTHKRRGRAGEREVVVLRLQVFTAIAAFLIVLGGIGAYIVANSPEVQLTLFGASPTPRPPTSTPTNTPTNTPGFTPTPSPTRDFTNEPTFTPSPTIFLSITPGQIEITPRPTEPYLPEEAGQAVRLADELLIEDQPDEAIPLLATAIIQSGEVFDPNPYYYQALAYAESGNVSAGLDTLAQAEGRIERLEGVRGDQAPFYKTLIDLGFAQIRLMQAREALAVNDRANAREYITEARERAESAVAVDNQMAQAYTVLAETYRLEEEYTEAVTILSEAQTFPALVTDLNLIVSKGNIYLDQGRAQLAAGDTEAARASFESASYEGFYAVYVNPFNQASHRLQIEAALARNDPGLAVIFSQGYLLYFPNSAEAFRQLGNARVAEGNTDLALEAYGRALQAEGTDEVIADVLISRASLYNAQRRYDLALADLNQAMELDPSLGTQVQRMYAAYNAGDYETAQADADALLTTGIIPDNEINLVKARILVDQADPSDTDAFNEALVLLNTMGNNLPPESIPLADEYRARAHFALGNLGDSLNAINRAIASVETGSRHFLRGQIHEARDERDDAIAEYQWVLTWNQVYNYDFAGEAQAGIDRILTTIANEQATATAVAVTATVAVEQATATQEAAITQTAEAFATLTVTAGVPITETAEAIASITATAGVPLTQTAEANGAATQQVLGATETIEAQETNTAATATAEIERATAILDTATAAAVNLQLSATARALITPTLTPEPTSAPDG